MIRLDLILRPGSKPIIIDKKEGIKLLAANQRPSQSLWTGAVGIEHSNKVVRPVNVQGLDCINHL